MNLVVETFSGSLALIREYLQLMNWDAAKSGEFRAFIEMLVSKSGPFITNHFRDGSWNLELKEDATPVTEADRGAEQILRGLISQSYPDHGIIGEEYGNEREDAEFVWVLDPIDGTASFVHGVPLFGTLIGLLHRGQPVIGAIHQPVVGQLCIGDNLETTLNGQSVTVRPCDGLATASVLTTDIANVRKYQEAAAFEKLQRDAKLFRTWGDCFGYLLVATGKADAMLDPIMNPWDVLPIIPVLRGAGAVVTDWRGGDPVQGNSCIAAAPALHAEILRTLQP